MHAGCKCFADHEILKYPYEICYEAYDWRFTICLLMLKYWRSTVSISFYKSEFQTNHRYVSWKSCEMRIIIRRHMQHLHRNSIGTRSKNIRRQILWQMRNVETMSAFICAGQYRQVKEMIPLPTSRRNVWQAEITIEICCSESDQY